MKTEEFHRYKVKRAETPEEEEDLYCSLYAWEVEALSEAINMSMEDLTFGEEPADFALIAPSSRGYALRMLQGQRTVYDIAWREQKEQIKKLEKQVEDLQKKLERKDARPVPSLSCG